MRLASFLILLLVATFVYDIQAQAHQVTKIGILGCHDQNKAAPSIPYFADKLKPEYCLWVGDNVYADTRDNPQHIQDELEKLASKPGFQELRKKSHFLVTWDDHDYGLNNAGKEYPLKEESKQIHRKFWQLEDKIPADRDGVYYAETEVLANGKIIQFIMLDGRFNRDNPRERNADALGEKQWKWLGEKLSEEADLRIITSGYQVLLQRPMRWEAWIRIGNSRDRLFELLRSKEVNNAIFVTGDQHYVEVLESSAKIPYHTWEIMAAGINKNERPGRARNRVAGPDTTINSSPMMEIHWTDNPYIFFKNYDVEKDAVSLEYRFEIGDIGWKD